MKIRRWLTVGLENGIFWPTEEVQVKYQGNEFLLRPETDQLAPSVALAYDPPQTDKDALLLIRRFLSTLSWVERGHLRETITLGSGGRPGCLGKGPGARLVNPRFRLDYLPNPADRKGQLCLALYREALNLNSQPFQFLGFFKIINALYATGKQQIACINNALPLLTDHFAQKRIQELKTQHTDVGAYLYESGRCAVAHAFNQPLVDPDDPDDTQRLATDLPVIRALVEHLMEAEIGIKSTRTYRREHLYELEGFRSLFGETLVVKLKAKQTVLVEEIPALPKLSVRIRDKAKYCGFESLRSTIAGVKEGCVFVRCDSTDGLVALVLRLNFPAERIEFNPQGGVSVHDDGSAHAAHVHLDDLRFFRDHICNGELEIWDAERQVRLGRTDPLIPMNVDLRGTVRNLDRIEEELEITYAVRNAPVEGPCSI